MLLTFIHVLICYTNYNIWVFIFIYFKILFNFPGCFSFDIWIIEKYSVWFLKFLEFPKCHSLFISDFILLWFKNILWIISNVLRVVLYPSFWSSLDTILYVLFCLSVFCCCWVECSIHRISVNSWCLRLLFILCLVLSNIASYIFNSDPNYLIVYFTFYFFQLLIHVFWMFFF